MEKEAEAVLGIAKKGPIAKYSIIRKPTENAGDIFFDIWSLKPSLSKVPTTSVKMASPTPERIKPNIARLKFSPDSLPKFGGNIRFPAPKKIPNNKRPVKNPFFIFLSYPSEEIKGLKPIMYTIPYKERIVKHRSVFVEFA